MASRNTELQVDDLLNNFDSGRTQVKGNKDNKKAKVGNDWGEEEEDNYVFSIGKELQAATKTKTTKKKTAGKGWGDLEAETKAQQPPKIEEVEKVEETAPAEKKKIFKKFTGETKPTAASVNVEEEYFPSLGEEIKRPAPKKPEAVVSSQSNTTSAPSTGGMRKFINAKKQGAGESFAPLNPDLVEKNLPVVQPKPEGTTEPTKRPEGGFQSFQRTERTEGGYQKPEYQKAERTEGYQKPEYQKAERTEGGFQRTEGTFQRRTNDAAPIVQETTPETDGKFKFGGEGPRKFVGANKISFKREEEKSELERLREEREREIEEKLAREREELNKQRELKMKAREGKDEGHKTEGHKTEVQKTETQTEGTEEKRIPKFANANKKDTDKSLIKNDKPKTVAPVETTPVTTTTQEEAKPTQPREIVEVNGTLSNKAWGDGPIVKKATAKK